MRGGGWSLSHPPNPHLNITSLESPSLIVQAEIASLLSLSLKTSDVVYTHTHMRAHMRTYIKSP